MVVMPACSALPEGRLVDIHLVCQGGGHAIHGMFSFGLVVMWWDVNPMYEVSEFYLE